jgi:hypothetical protein
MTNFKKAMRLLATLSILGALIACGGDDEANNSNNTANTATPATQPANAAVAAAQPAAGAPLAMQVGQPPQTLNVPIPPSFDLTVAAPGEYQIDISAQGNDPRMFLYQGDTLVEDDDDGGDNTNARIVRFLTPGTYSVRVTEYRARTVTVQGQAQLLQPLAPTATLTLGAPTVINFPEFGFTDRPENDRGASRAANFTVAAPGQYTCTATMDNDRRVKMQLIQGGTLVAEDDQGFTEQNASITQQLQPGEYQIRVFETIYRGQTNATITCRQG